MTDIAHVSVVDTDDGRKQLIVAITLDDAGAVQIADLLTRPAQPTRDDVRGRIPKKPTPRRK